MPLARIALKRGRSDDFLASVADAVYQSLRAIFGIPDDDRFAIIEQREDNEIIFDRGYLVTERTDGLMIIEITANDTRTAAQKEALYRDMSARLIALGVAPGDVFIVLNEIKPENWSFGEGRMAYPPRDLEAV